MYLPHPWGRYIDPCPVAGGDCLQPRNVGNLFTTRIYADNITNGSIHLATIVWRSVGDGVSHLDLNTSRLLDIDAMLLTPLIELDGWIVVGDVPGQNRVWLPMAFHHQGSRR